MRPIPIAGTLVLGLALLAACADRTNPTAVSTIPRPNFATRPVGPVTIQTLIDFSEPPFNGTFEVIAGSGLLGCEGGTFVDFPAPAGGRAKIAKVFTCDGPGTGTFTANFEPTPAPGPGDANGHWNIVRSDGDFANLRGVGDFSVVFVEPASGVETLTGKIHFDP